MNILELVFDNKKIFNLKLNLYQFQIQIKINRIKLRMINLLLKIIINLMHARRNMIILWRFNKWDLKRIKYPKQKIHLYKINNKLELHLIHLILIL